jgi:adenosylcobinamide kinase/adenosylcobinamide-phosphate guanylyltransferase
VNDQETTSEPGPILLGSLGQAMPVPGCGCVRCRAGLTRTASRQRHGIRFPGRVDLDGPGPDTGPELRLTTRNGHHGRWLPPGERLEHAGLRIISLPTTTPRECVLVVADGGRTLLWAPRSAPLPETTLEAVADAAVDHAALGLVAPGRGQEFGGQDGITFEDDTLEDGTRENRTPGDRDTDGPQRYDIGMAHRIARLRSVGALTHRTTITAVGLTHDTPLVLSPPPEDTIRMLHRWGARIGTDGMRLHPWSLPGRTDPGRTDRPEEDPPPGPRRVIVLGGASSGKSRTAEALLAAEPHVLYAATGPAPDPRHPDPDWTARIRIHRYRRPPWWNTDEEPDLAGLLSEPGPAVLVDSLGGWLTAALDRCGAWDGRDGWRHRLRTEVDALIGSWRRTPRDVVAVAEDVGAGIIPATSAGRLFREELGALVQRLASESEELCTVAAGRIVHHTQDGPRRR